MNVVHLISTLSARDGGPPIACLGLADAAARRGHDVVILTTDWDGSGRTGPGEEIHGAHGVRVVRFPVGFPRAIKTSWPLRAAFRHHLQRADVVHVHGLYLFVDWIAATLCQRQGVPYVLQTHGGLLPPVRRRHAWIKKIMAWVFQRRMFDEAAAILFTSEHERRLSAPFLGRAEGHVVPLGVETAAFADATADDFFRRYPGLYGKKIVLFVGRVHFVKGLDILMDAFAALAPEIADAVLVVAGPDEAGLGRRLAARLAKHGLEERMIFTGMLDGATVRSALKAAAVLALPSRGENFSLTVVEAMAAGLPVVVSPEVGVASDLAEAGAGLVVERRAGAVAGALAHYLAHPDAARRSGENGRILAASRFSLAASGAALDRVYTRARAGAGAEATP